MHLNWQTFGGPLQALRPFETGLHLQQRVFLPRSAVDAPVDAGGVLAARVFAARPAAPAEDQAGQVVQRQIFSPRAQWGYALSGGWAVTNVTPDTSYDANATTTDELADVLGTLIQALILKGILGV